MKITSETIRSSMTEQCHRRGYAAPVDVLLDVGVLEKKKHEDWRYGRVTYLEQVCNANLHKLTEIMKNIRICAKDLDLQPSFFKTLFQSKGNRVYEKRSPLQKPSP